MVEEIDNTDKQQKKKYSNFLLRRWQFYKRIQESLDQHHKERDQMELKATAPPEGENIELQSTWVTEVYTSSHIEGLIKSFKRLGWDKPEPANTNHDLVSWIRNARSRGGWGWANGGIVRDARRKIDGLLINTRFAELPEGVEYAHLSLHKISSSIVIVGFQFVHHKEVASSIMNPLRDNYMTYVKYHPSVLNFRSARYITPTQQKQEAYNKSVERLHRPLYVWFRKNLPGYFSSLEASSFPTIDLVTSLAFDDTEVKGKIDVPEYLDPVIKLSGNLWNAENWSDLKLVIPFSGEADGKYALFGNYKKLVKRLKGYGGEDRDGLANMLDLMFPNTVCLLTAHHLLQCYEKSLLQLRDKSTKDIRTMRKALKDAAYVRHSFLSISKDIKAASKELGKSAKKNDIPYQYFEAMDFIPPTYLKKYEKNLIKTISSQDELIASELLETEEDVREVILSSSATASTIANLRIQRWVFWLTLATVAFTIVNFIQVFGGSNGK